MNEEEKNRRLKSYDEKKKFFAFVQSFLFFFGSGESDLLKNFQLIFSLSSLAHFQISEFANKKKK